MRGPFTPAHRAKMSGSNTDCAVGIGAISTAHVDEMMTLMLKFCNSVNKSMLTSNKKVTFSRLV